MKQKRPLILVTGPAKGGYSAWFFTRLSVWLAGGRPRLVHPNNWQSLSKDRDLHFDGLIIGGGADVNPQLYGETLLQTLSEEIDNKQTWNLAWVVYLLKAAFVYGFRMLFGRRGHTGFLDHARDKIELSLIGRAIEKGIPILGICRGCQLLNVYFQGSLHQNIKNFYVEYPQYRSILPKKMITLEEGTRLSAILNLKTCTVNALHNQAVNQLSPMLRVAAREGNGVVQAIESVSHKATIIGVQWHPEYLVQRKEQRLLFQWLVQESVTKRVEKESLSYVPSRFSIQS